MKVALLISGLPRKVEEGYKASWKDVIETYDTDVYLHAWKDEEWEKVMATYPNAKSIQIQEPFKFTKYKKGIKLPHDDTSRPLPQYDVMSCFRQLPMFYSWQMVYKPMFDSMIDYDVIIRSRYDVAMEFPIKLDKLDMSKINHKDVSGQFFDDNLCIANKHNSDKLFKNIFNDVIKHSRKTGILTSAEETWTLVMERNDLRHAITKHNTFHFTLLRDDKVWWGDENGNII